MTRNPLDDQEQETDIMTEHDDRCCMEGVRPTAGPDPDCPGFEALPWIALTPDLTPDNPAA